jgi:hypothetical protein
MVDSDTVMVHPPFSVSPVACKVSCYRQLLIFKQAVFVVVGHTQVTTGPRVFEQPSLCLFVCLLLSHSRAPRRDTPMPLTGSQFVLRSCSLFVVCDVGVGKIK